MHVERVDGPVRNIARAATSTVAGWTGALFRVGRQGCSTMEDNLLSSAGSPPSTSQSSCWPLPVAGGYFGTTRRGTSAVRTKTTPLSCRHKHRHVCAEDNTGRWGGSQPTLPSSTSETNPFRFCGVMVDVSQKATHSDVGGEILCLLSKTGAGRQRESERDPGVEISTAGTGAHRVPRPTRGCSMGPWCCLPQACAAC